MQPDLKTGYLLNIITRAKPVTPVFDGPQAAVVVQAVSGGVFFTIPSYDPNLKFGPAPYQAIPGASPSVPPAGTRCVAIPVSGLSSEPNWMVSCFQGWPQIPASVTPASASSRANAAASTPTTH